MVRLQRTVTLITRVALAAAGKAQPAEALLVVFAGAFLRKWMAFMDVWVDLFSYGLHWDDVCFVCGCSISMG